MARSILELLKTVQECGAPELVSLYDEEAVDGFEWTHPDGRTWTDIHSWNPEHPLLQEVSRDDLAETIHRWLERNNFLTEDIIAEQDTLTTMTKEDLIHKYSGISE